MAINYDKWKNRWSSNEIIVLVLLSLGMQIGLIVLAPLRKRSKNPVLKLTLWLLYLTADSVAILALGNISNQADPEQSDVDSGTLPAKLTVLWAPFLLVHLGGPDSITSYSVEDNELWWRHLLGLVVQVVVTIYVFWQSPPKGLMWIPTVLVFIPGLIKFAERTHALRLGSKDNLKDKIISDLTIGKDQGKVITDSVRGDSKGETNGAPATETPPQQQNAAPATETEDDLPENEKESKNIYEGYKWFNQFKRLLVDVTFESNMLMESQDYFSEMDAKGALNMVAIELSFMYDILHTKAVHMHNNGGRVLRCFSLLSIIAALIVFLHLDRQKYASKDIIITYILFGAGLILEVIAGVLLISSDWTVVSLRKNKGLRKRIADSITSMVKTITGRKGKSRWSRNIGQFSLVGLCLRDRYTPSTWIMKKLIKIKDKWDNMRESRSIPLEQGMLQNIMFTEAKRRAQNVHIYNVLLEARSYRGGKSLERHGKRDKLEWSMKREFDESIILWHVATDICYYEDETSNKPNGEKQEPSHPPNGENQEASDQPNVRNEETSSQPNGENQEPSHPSNGENQEPSHPPNGENQEPSHPPSGENQQPSDQPNGTSKQPNGKKDTERDVSWKTSNYMIYLLTQQQSMMQLGYGKTRFEATCAVVKKKLKGEKTLDPKKARDVLKKNEGAAKNEEATQVSEQNNASVSAGGSQPTNQMGTFGLKSIWASLRRWVRRKREEDKRKRKDENEIGELVLRDSSRLANELLELKSEIRWKLISETWMEMLGYAAIHCDSYQHAKSLRRGGELLTHLWLLMSQLGVVEEHKVQQYQSATV
ncbi:uncharacterized protein LOC144561019 isoform X2 [Carex rostrata]